VRWHAKATGVRVQVAIANGGGFIERGWPVSIAPAGGGRRGGVSISHRYRDAQVPTPAFDDIALYVSQVGNMLRHVKGLLSLRVGCN
jgi:hypothetical protein